METMNNEYVSIPELSQHNLLIPLLQRRVIADAINEEELTKEEFIESRHQFMRNRGLNDDTALNALMMKQGWSQKDLEWQIALPAKIENYCIKQYRHKAEAHFLSRKNQLDKVVYSLLRVKDHYLAQELYWRIEAGEANFGDLASAYAEGPERTTKGIIGPVSMSQAHPVLAEALRISKPGSLISPIQIGEWYIVARLETYTPATFDGQTAVALSKELFDQWIDDEVARRMKDLVDRMSIQTTNDEGSN